MHRCWCILFPMDKVDQAGRQLGCDGYNAHDGSDQGQRLGHSEGSNWILQVVQTFCRLLSLICGKYSKSASFQRGGPCSRGIFPYDSYEPNRGGAARSLDGLGQQRSAPSIRASTLRMDFSSFPIEYRYAITLGRPYLNPTCTTCLMKYSVPDRGISKT